jgi:plastocyanin
MTYFLRALALAMVLVVPALLLAGCNRAASGSDPDGVPRAASGAKTTPETTPAAAPANARTPVPKAETNQVVIDNFAFRPQLLTVAAGTKVTWVNQDDVPHTVTSTARPRVFASGTLDTDDRFAHVFTKPGTYEYFCAVHPHMTGKVVVK